MQLNTEFEGINKPRNLYKSKTKIGKDGLLRAGYRHIFITIRDSNKNFNDINVIMKLVLHELAHTMCNHVTWRDDDHNSDFIHCEKILINAYNNIIQHL